MDEPEDIMLCEMKQTKKDRYCMISVYVKIKGEKVKLIEIENRIVISRNWRMEEMGTFWLKSTNFNYKNKFWEFN